MGDAADDRGMRRTFIVPAIKSFEHYDFTRAKISCSLTWLVAKAFGSGRSPLQFMGNTAVIIKHMIRMCTEV